MDGGGGGPGSDGSGGGGEMARDARFGSANRSAACSCGVSGAGVGQSQLLDSRLTRLSLCDSSQARCCTTRCSESEYKLPAVTTPPPLPLPVSLPSLLEAPLPGMSAALRPLPPAADTPDPSVVTQGSALPV